MAYACAIVPSCHPAGHSCARCGRTLFSRFLYSSLLSRPTVSLAPSSVRNRFLSSLLDQTPTLPTNNSRSFLGLHLVEASRRRVGAHGLRSTQEG